MYQHKQPLMYRLGRTLSSNGPIGIIQGLYLRCWQTVKVNVPTSTLGVRSGSRYMHTMHLNAVELNVKQIDEGGMTIPGSDSSGAVFASDVIKQTGGWVS